MKVMAILPKMWIFKPEMLNKIWKDTKIKTGMGHFL